MNKRNRFIIFIILFFLQFLNSQEKSCNKALDFFLSFTEVFYINLGVTTANNLITGYEWSYFLPEIIKENFSLPPVWDISSFSRNQLAHPYFGSFYFNAARTNGMNFYESFLFTAAGSAMYETLIERGNISINDLITTSYAGTLTGEMLFRLGNQTSVINPLFNFIINPMSFINYLIKKDTVRCKAPDYFYHSYSSRTIYDFYNNTALTGIALNIKYNKPYRQDTIEPFDQFNLCINALAGKEGFSYDYKLDGALFSRNFNESTFGICSLYEADKKINDNFSDSSIGLFYSYSKDVNDFRLSADCKIYYTLLATSLPCNYGHGPAFNTSVNLNLNRSGNITTDYSVFFLFPYDGSYATVQKLYLSYTLKFARYFFINTEASFMFNEKTKCFLTIDIGACFD
ncbi:MAG: DUF3943 domain-containing protein [Treponema sp.]|nr:DUF3943 domain-containing protein [Treponema sp.]